MACEMQMFCQSSPSVLRPCNEYDYRSNRLMNGSLLCAATKCEMNYVSRSLYRNFRYNKLAHGHGTFCNGEGSAEVNTFARVKLASEINLFWWILLSLNGRRHFSLVFSALSKWIRVVSKRNCCKVFSEQFSDVVTIINWMPEINRRKTIRHQSINAI